MSGKTSIEWSDHVWNPTVGCTRVSPGCKECYAFALHDRRHQAFKEGKSVPKQYAKPFTVLQTMEDRLADPLHWRTPRRVFVNSVSDLFHKDVPDDFLDRVFAVMAMSPGHTFQVLTKRADRMRDYLRTVQDDDKDLQRFANVASELTDSPCAAGIFDEVAWPFPNVWLGVSVENREQGCRRLPALRDTPAAVRFVSFEPLLEDVGDIHWPGIHWAIVGGESGPNARPMHPDWARSLRDQCQEAGVAFFFKQWGNWKPITRADGIHESPFGAFDVKTRFGFIKGGKKAAGRELDGRVWDEFPEVVRA